MEQRGIAAKAKETVLPYFQRKEFRYELALMGFSCLMGSVVIGGRILPLASAAVAAAWLAGKNPYYALFGAAAGAAMRGRIDAAVSPFLYMLLCLLWRAWRGELKKTQKLLMLPVSHFLMMPFCWMSSAEECVIGLLQAALAAVSVGVLQHGLLAVRSLRLRRIATEEEKISLLLTAGLIVLALAGMRPLGFSPGTAAAVFLCLVFALSLGGGAAAGAVLLGAALTLAGGYNVIFIGFMAACALAGAVMRPLGRGGVSAGFLACALLIRAYAGESYSFALLEMFAGIGAFLLFPRRWVRTFCTMTDAELYRMKTGRNTVRRMRERAGNRLELTADAFRQIAELFARRTEDGLEQSRMAVNVAAAMCVCADCSRAEQCWKDVRAAADAFAEYQQAGGERLPAPFCGECLRKKQLRRTADAAMEQYRLREEQARRNEECQQFTHRQLSGVCSVMRALSEKTKQDTWFDEELEARLKMRLDKARIRTRELDALRDGKKLTIRILLCSGQDRESAAAAVSGFLHRKMRACSGSSPTELYLADRPRFDAKLAFSSRPSPESGISGDSMDVRELEDGKLFVLLSDGMGTGAQAHGESAAAVALLGNLLSAGFEPGLAMESVNRLLIARRKDDMYATLDAMLLDMNTGTARFIKCGAPPGYILRGGRVYTLYCEALPAGIVEEARAAVQQVRLRQGDSVILMTDGVADALGSGLYAAIVERVGAANTVQDAADALVAAAAEDGAADDLSAVIIRI